MAREMGVTVVPPWNEALSPPSRRQEGEKAEANARLGGADPSGGPPGVAPDARLPLLRPLGLEMLRQLCGRGWPSRPLLLAKGLGGHRRRRETRRERWGEGGGDGEKRKEGREREAVKERAQKSQGNRN